MLLADNSKPDPFDALSAMADGVDISAPSAAPAANAADSGVVVLCQGETQDAPAPDKSIAETRAANQVRSTQMARSQAALEQHLPEFLLSPGRDDFTLLDTQGRDVVGAVLDLGDWGSVVELSNWLKRSGLEPGDDVVLTVRSYKRRSFLIEHQPPEARDEAAIAAVTRKLSDALMEQLQASRDSLLYLQHALPPAWLEVPAVKLTAPEALSLLVMEDGRMELCGGAALRRARKKGSRGPGV